MVAAGDVRRRHHLRLKVRGALVRVRVRRPGEKGQFVGERRIPGWETGQHWRAGTEPKREPGEARGGSGRRVCAVGAADSRREGPGELGNGTAVDGETPGGAGNEVLQSETPAESRAWVCGRTTPGRLEIELWG